MRDPLVALRDGDPLPFEDFVRRRTRTLIAYFVQQGASLARAEDLTQEVFVKLFRCAGRYRPQERFAAFCFRIARNVWIDDCRRSASRADAPGRCPGTAVEELGCHRHEAEPVWDGTERAMGELFSRLTPAHRRVLELVLLGELSYAEIGSLLSIPVGTVKSRVFHAVRHLRRICAGSPESEGVA